jgi:hypothetical protein
MKMGYDGAHINETNTQERQAPDTLTRSLKIESNEDNQQGHEELKEQKVVGV